MELGGVYNYLHRIVLCCVNFSYFCIPLRRKGNSEKGKKQRKIERRVKEEPVRVCLNLESFTEPEKIKNKKLDKVKKIPTFAVPTKRELNGGCREALARLKRYGFQNRSRNIKTS